MRRKLIIGLAFFTTLLLTGSRFFDSFVTFIVSGRVPVLGVVIPPTLMIILWTAILPVVAITHKISKVGLWNLVETIGDIHQRQINRHIRWRIASSDLLLVLAAVYIHRLAKLPSEKPSKHQALFTPRRFIALPA